MIKKNRHRAGRKKREKILRAQLRALSEGKHTVISRPIVRVNPQIREPTVQQQNPPVPLIDLTNDFVNEVPLLNNTYSSDDEVEFIEETPAVNNELEPLDPGIEFRHNVTQLFINLEEYARTVFEISE